MVFERDRPVPLLQMLGGWEPSRAVNQSDGLDPVSLGMAPPIAATAPSRPIAAPPTMVDVGAEMPATQASPAEELQLRPSMGAYAPPEPVPSAYVNLDHHYAMLGGRRIRLNGEAEQAIISALIVAMEVQVMDEVATLKMEFGLADSAFQAGSRAPTNAIPQTDGPTAGEVQPVSETTSTKAARVPTVRRRQTRSAAATPHAQLNLPLDADGAAPRPDTGV